MRSATLGLVEAGKPPTFVNIGKELGCSKQAVSQLFRRHPDLWVWIDRHVQSANQHFVGSIVYRHSMLAMQGSVNSAELVFKFHGGMYGARRKDEDRTRPDVHEQPGHHQLAGTVPDRATHRPG
jgi:hypothetical protein